MKKKDIQNEMDPIFRSLIEGPPKTRKVNKWMQLRDYMEETGITPEDVFKLIRSKATPNVRFNWKMIRFTLFIWARIDEDKGGYLKPKIDTVRHVVRSIKFRQYFVAYFGDKPFDEEKEIILLNKLIAEKPQKKYFKEGYYYYNHTSKYVPQSTLDRILWDK